MCLYPKLITNKKYVKTKKNGGIIPPITDPRVTKVPIGCSKCIECRKQKSNEWKTRLSFDIKKNTNGKFVTLTFSNESIRDLANEYPKLDGYNLDNQIATLALRRFLERYRKKYKRSIRHWMVTELGHNGTENIHLHGILWTDNHGDEIEKIWSYGFIWRGYTYEQKINGWSNKSYVNGATINYITKYITKQDEKHKHYMSKILTSAGIGDGYQNTHNAKLNKYTGSETEDTYKHGNGTKGSLPIYFRNKLYTEEEREKLWLHKLDKNERYILGTKVKADDYYSYNTLLKQAQALNKQLGYGDDTKNWKEEEYERERRKLLMQTRIKNNKKQNDGLYYEKVIKNPSGTPTGGGY